MGVSNRHILHQGPVLGALARAAFMGLKSAYSDADKASVNNAPKVPGKLLQQRIPARDAALVRDYIRHVGGDPRAYGDTVPAHLFPQWVFPLQARGLEDVPYPMHKVLNGGCRIEINHALPLGEPLQVSVRLEDVDDNGQRAILHQRSVTGTARHPEAMVAHVYAFVPLKKKKKKKSGTKPSSKRAPARVPADARELSFWRLSAHAGLDFAKLTGDFNPIHWVPPAAHAAGFRNVILHGFATLARAVEGLNRSLFAGDIHRLASVDVQFTRPLVLPVRVGLYVAGNDMRDIYVGDAPGGPAYLAGAFTTKPHPRDPAT